MKNPSGDSCRNFKFGDALHILVFLSVAKSGGAEEMQETEFHKLIPGLIGATSRVISVWCSDFILRANVMFLIGVYKCPGTLSFLVIRKW